MFRSITKFPTQVCFRAFAPLLRCPQRISQKPKTLTTTTALHPSSFLIGPPELYRPSATAAAAAVTGDSSDAPTGNAFVDSMTADFNNISSEKLPEMGLTENGSATFLSSGNPCLDFFFHVVPDTPAWSIKQRLDLAWSHDPLQTLKLVCNLRGVKGTGKADKEGFYTVALWLHTKHPKTLAGNLAAVAKFGYFKDLPEILYRLLYGAKIRKREKITYEKWQKLGYVPIKEPDEDPENGSRNGSKPKTKIVKTGPKLDHNEEECRKKKKTGPKINHIEECRKRKHEKRLEMAKKVMEKINSDPDFRFLYERVADLFAEQLKSDMESLKAGETTKISLGAKWCPSIDCSFDRATLICELIARKVFPRESHPEYEEIEDAHYAYRVRDRLRKEVLVPLHKTLELPEVFMSAKQWSSLPYRRVASVAMKTLKTKFLAHDEERFNAYLGKVKEGKASIAAGALLPHQIIASLNDEDGGEVAELQWKRMVEDLAKKGKLKNCMAICDVSGSMTGDPMEVSVALGVLVSELSEDPWKGKLITFSANPELQEVKGKSLKEKTDFVRSMEWGMNTDFQKVFDTILEVAVKGKLKEEEMIKRLFVFSDMEFDQARSSYDGYGYPSTMESPNAWDTDYEVIRSKYREKGYGNAVPEIVFWNLRYSNATPVPSSQKGVALVSGFSKNLLKLFLEDNGSLDPIVVMEAAIAGKEYQKLVVLD